jgi:hypothetical protein
LPFVSPRPSPLGRRDSTIAVSKDRYKVSELTDALSVERALLEQFEVRPTDGRTASRSNPPNYGGIDGATVFVDRRGGRIYA